MPLDEDILKILACPKCQGDLLLVENATGLACQACRLRYPIEKNIPVLLIEDAEEWRFQTEEQADLES